jgi:hypothetical protein
MSMTRLNMEIKVTTVQHGFALEVGQKSWLCENELELAEAVAFRVGMGCTKPVSKKKMRMLLKAMANGNKGFIKKQKH